MSARCMKKCGRETTPNNTEKLIDRSIDVNAIYDIELFIFFIRNAIEILIRPKEHKATPYPEGNGDHSCE
jgi:hypothetical protein